jgi:hypothetical protein
VNTFTNSVSGSRRAHGSLGRRLAGLACAAGTILAATLLAACGGVGAGASAAASASSGGAAPPNTARSATIALSAPPTTAEAPRMQFYGGASLVPPAGWVVHYYEDIYIPGTGGPPHDQFACLEPAGGDTTADRTMTCGSGILVEAKSIDGAELSRFTPHQSNGWYSNTGVVACPVGPDDVTTNPAGDSGAPIAQASWTVDGHVGAYDRWVASCRANGFTYQPQSWYLPTGPFRILSVVDLHPTELAQVVASVGVNG